MFEDHFVACGWYTPDYAKWVSPLLQRLDTLGVPHDFVKVDKRPGGWEANTLAKPLHARNARSRHPDKTILLLDVDCDVLGTRDDLARIANIEGDVGLYAKIKVRRSGKPVFGARSGTMVLRPNENTHTLIAEWIKACDVATPFAVDQDILVAALGRVPHLSITILDITACAVPQDDVASPLILHDSASLGSRTGKLTKLASRVWG